MSYIYYTSSDEESRSPIITGLICYGSYFLLLNTLIPISLLVTLETVKFIQSWFIENDMLMYDKDTGKKTKAISICLNEQLALVDYIFADKTGTLTANIMEFKGCSVAGLCYDEQFKQNFKKFKLARKRYKKLTKASRRPKKRSIDSDKGLCCFTDRLTKKNLKIMEKERKEKLKFELKKAERKNTFTELGEFSQQKPKTAKSRILWRFDPCEILREFFKGKFSLSNIETMHRHNYKLMRQNEYLNEFWLNIALCHDVIPTYPGLIDVDDRSNDWNGGKNERNLNSGTMKEVEEGEETLKEKTSVPSLVYQGPSPDELTLVDAAKQIGYILKAKSSNSATLDLLQQEVHFDIIHKLPFTSERKRMSVIVRDTYTSPNLNHSLKLYIKGADDVIFQRMSQNFQPFENETSRHLSHFAKKVNKNLFPFHFFFRDTEHFALPLKFLIKTNSPIGMEGIGN